MSDSEFPAAEEAVAVPQGSLREQVAALGEKRALTEANLKDALAYLESTPVGLYEPLIDEERFPRSDCDLYAVRTARNTVHCSCNDLRDIEEDLHQRLGELHEASRDVAARQMTADTEARVKGKAEAVARQRRAAAAQRVAKLAPILTVASVEAGSPAAAAGLTAGAEVLQYGDLSAANLAERGGLAAMAAVTKEHERQMLSVWVRTAAEAEPTELFVVPQTWPGKGLLGCALDPV